VRVSLLGLLLLLSACTRPNKDYDPGDAAGPSCGCDAPPEDQCIDAATLRVYSTKGSCASNACSYAHWDDICESGCMNGACVGNDLCDGITCLEPPAASCSDKNTLVSYASSGTCSMGHCGYASTQTACPGGCAQGACTGDACAGITCTLPPTSSCVDANTLRSYGSGMCQEGVCSYAPVDTTCQSGCVNGACVGDPCAGLLCEEPPAPACISTTTLRNYDTLGVCANGVCSYTSFDTTCLVPANGVASCANGACGFVCNQGFVKQGSTCVSQVVTGGLTWTAVSTGSTADLNGVWGTGSDLYAVGTAVILRSTDGGQTFTVETNADTLLGVWGSGPSDIYVAGGMGIQHSTDGVTWTIVHAAACSMVGGTAANDVYALCGTQLLHCTDGATWDTSYTMTDTTSYGEIWAASAADVYAASWNTTTNDLIYNAGTVNWSENAAIAGLSAVWGTSATNVYVATTAGGIEHSTDGTTFTAQTSSATGAIFWMWGSGPTDVYAVGQDGVLHSADGQTWATLSVSTSAVFNGMWGSSATNVFVVGFGGAFFHGHN
jgi:hypothetical protein